MKVSVLMSCYNASEHIRRSIDSILCQSFKEFEFIIINDGSVDETARIINSYKDPRIKFIDLLSNIGLVDALNLGLDVCKGKYIARMDADDISLTNRLAIQKKFLDNNPDVIAAGSSIINFDKYGNEIEVEFPLDHNSIALHLVTFERTICHPAVMFRKDIVTKRGIKYNPEHILCEDYHFWYQLSKAGQLANIGTPLIKYFRGSCQSSNKYKILQLQNTKNLLRIILKKYDFGHIDLVIDYLTISKVLTKNQRNKARDMISESTLFKYEFSKDKIKDVLALKELRFSSQYLNKTSVVLALAKYLLCEKQNFCKKLIFLWKVRGIEKMKL